MSPLAVIAAERVGYALDVDFDCVGAVHSVFSRAVNLEIQGEMWTLLASDGADLPFGIRLPVRSFGAFALDEGDGLHLRAGFVGVGRADRRIVVDCRAAPVWAPSPHTGIAHGFAARLARLSQATTARAWVGSRAMAREATRSLQGEARALEPALAAIVGCGSTGHPGGHHLLLSNRRKREPAAQGQCDFHRQFRASGYRPGQ